MRERDSPASTRRQNDVVTRQLTQTHVQESNFVLKNLQDKLFSLSSKDVVTNYFDKNHQKIRNFEQVLNASALLLISVVVWKRHYNNVYFVTISCIKAISYRICWWMRKTGKRLNITWFLPHDQITGGQILKVITKQQDNNFVSTTLPIMVHQIDSLLFQIVRFCNGG